MLSFDNKTLKKIKEGRITLVIRNWRSMQVKEGAIYTLESVGNIKVEHISLTLLSDLTEQDASNAGYSSLYKLKKNYLGQYKNADWNNDKCVMIQFYPTDELDEMGNLRLFDFFQLERIEQKFLNKEWIYYYLKQLNFDEFISTKQLAAQLHTTPVKLSRRMRQLHNEDLILHIRSKGYKLSKKGKQYWEFIK